MKVRPHIVIIAVPKFLRRYFGKIFEHIVGTRLLHDRTPQAEAGASGRSRGMTSGLFRRRTRLSESVRSTGNGVRRTSNHEPRTANHLHDSDYQSLLWAPPQCHFDTTSHQRFAKNMSLWHPMSLCKATQSSSSLSSLTSHGATFATQR
jgi:hypothetical protein